MDLVLIAFCITDIGLQYRSKVALRWSLFIERGAVAQGIKQHGFLFVCLSSHLAPFGLFARLPFHNLPRL